MFVLRIVDDFKKIILQFRRKAQLWLGGVMHLINTSNPTSSAPSHGAARPAAAQTYGFSEETYEVIVLPGEPPREAVSAITMDEEPRAQTVGDVTPTAAARRAGELRRTAGHREKPDGRPHSDCGARANSETSRPST